MPRVIIQTVEGRSVQQKRELVRRITDAVVDVWNAEPDGVSVLFVEVPPENLARAGILMVDKDPSGSP